jgi:hypothetical protein
MYLCHIPLSFSEAIRKNPPTRNATDVDIRARLESFLKNSKDRGEGRKRPAAADRQ